MRDLGDVARMAAVLPGALERAQLQGVQQSALFVTRGIRDEIRSVTGDMRLSGVGARGARVGAKYDVKGTTNPTAIISATGPLQLIERRTNPHPISNRRRSKKKALKMADGGFAKSAMHPGTPAKRPFAKGVSRTADRTGVIFDEAVQGAIRAVLR